MYIILRLTAPTIKTHTHTRQEVTIHPMLMRPTASGRLRTNSQLYAGCQHKSNCLTGRAPLSHILRTSMRCIAIVIGDVANLRCYVSIATSAYSRVEFQQVNPRNCNVRACALLHFEVKPSLN